MSVFSPFSWIWICNGTPSVDSSSEIQNISRARKAILHIVYCSVRENKRLMIDAHFNCFGNFQKQNKNTTRTESNSKRIHVRIHLKSNCIYNDYYSIQSPTALTLYNVYCTVVHVLHRIYEIIRKIHICKYFVYNLSAVDPLFMK